MNNFLLLADNKTLDDALKEFFVKIGSSNQTLMQQAYSSGWISNVFPIVWLTALPAFWLGCVVVRLFEGKERQPFIASEAWDTFKNQCLLGFLWSFGPIMNKLLPASKTEMTIEEFVWKSAVATLIVDLAFYLVHRALHEVPSLRWIHAKHHALRINHTVWGGLDEGPYETLTIFGYVTLPFLFITVSPDFFVLFITGGAFQTALMHGSGLVQLLPWPLVEGTFHHGHHVHLRKNYAGVYVFWDHLFGTALTKQATEAARDKPRTKAVIKITNMDKDD